MSDSKQKSARILRDRLRRELRYASAAQVAADFPTAHDRKVIAAVLRWVSHNSAVAWRDGLGRYDTVWNRDGQTRDLRHTDAIVIQEADWDAATRILVGERPKAKRRRKVDP